MLTQAFTTNTMKKIFVSGADGMLGSNICRELLKQGYLVKALCLPNTKSKTLDELDIEKVYGDILDQDFLQREMQACYSAIHVAALTTVWPRRSKIIKAVNLQGTINIADAVEALKLDCLVHIGTANSFGHGPKSQPGDERSPFCAAQYGMDYIDSKLQAQQMLLERHERNGLPVVIINPTFMIGAYDAGPSSGQMLLGLHRGAIPAYSKGGKNFISAADVATAAVNALKMGRKGECYIAGHENLEFKAFFMKASQVLDQPFRMRAAPQWLILMLGAFNSILARIIGKPPKLSFTMARMAGTGQYFSSEKAQRELNMPQTPVEEAIRQCVAWFKENGYWS